MVETVLVEILASHVAVGGHPEHPEQRIYQKGEQVEMAATLVPRLGGAVRVIGEKLGGFLKPELFAELVDEAGEPVDVPEATDLEPEPVDTPPDRAVAKPKKTRKE